MNPSVKGYLRCLLYAGGGMLRDHVTTYSSESLDALAEVIGERVSSPTRIIHRWMTQAEVFDAGQDGFSIRSESAYLAIADALHLTHEVTNRDAWTDEGRVTMTNAVESTRDWPIPERRPFPAMFVGYGDGSIVTARYWHVNEPGAREYPDAEALVHGHLIAPSGAVIAFVEPIGVEGHLAMGVPQDVSMAVCWARGVIGGWPRPLLLESLVLRSFMDDIEAAVHVETHGTSKSLRRRIGKHQRRLPPDLRVVPRQWHRVEVKPTVIRHRARRQWEPYARRRMSHRWTVRAHDRVYVRRGMLPIDPDDLAALERRGRPTSGHPEGTPGYRVWTTGQPDGEERWAMKQRGYVPRRLEDEWLAVKVVRIEAHEKGPEEAPLVRSVRVPG